ncbi:MAG: hypothetical protein ACQSGP_11215 [Frankia sp.]
MTDGPSSAPPDGGAGANGRPGSGSRASGPGVGGSRAAGSVAQEAALLLEALRGLAAQHDPTSSAPASADGAASADGEAAGGTDRSPDPAAWETAGPAGGSGPPPGATGERPARTLSGHAAACGYCPFCRLVAALGITRPDVIAHLSDAGTSILAALRASLGPDPATGGPPDGSGSAPAAGRPPRPTVQRIDIT